MRGIFGFVLVLWHFKDRFFKFETNYFSVRISQNIIENQRHFSAAKLIETSSFSNIITSAILAIHILDRGKGNLVLELKLNVFLSI